MTPADEIEYIIKEIAVNDGIKSYKITSFPEICFEKYKFYYIVEISEDYWENNDINKRFKELRNELRTREITFENKILDTDRNILFEGDNLSASVPIFYKDCIFTSPYDGIGEYCENCII